MTVGRVELAFEVHERRVAVPLVGVLRGEARGLLLARPADENRRTARRDRSRRVPRVGHGVVSARERGLRLGEHAPTDLQRLLEPLEALAHRRELEPERGVFGVEPGGADTEKGPAVRDHVERGHGLGQERRISIRHAGHECAEPSGLRAGRERAEQR